MAAATVVAAGGRSGGRSGWGSALNGLDWLSIREDMTSAIVGAREGDFSGFESGRVLVSEPWKLKLPLIWETSVGTCYCLGFMYVCETSSLYLMKIMSFHGSL